MAEANTGRNGYRVFHTAHGLGMIASLDYCGPGSRVNCVFPRGVAKVIARGDVQREALDYYVLEADVLALLADLELDQSLCFGDCRELVTRLAVRALSVSTRGAAVALVQRLHAQLEDFDQLFLTSLP